MYYIFYLFIYFIYRLALEILRGRGEFLNCMGNEDEPIFRGNVLQIRLNFGYLLQAVSIRTNSLDKECLFFTGHIWECTPGKYCNDY